MPHFIKSERGNPILQHGHHEYNYREKQKKYHLWRCVNRLTIVGCNGAVGTKSTTDENTEVIDVRPHICNGHFFNFIYTRVGGNTLRKERGEEKFNFTKE